MHALGFIILVCLFKFAGIHYGLVENDIGKDEVAYTVFNSSGVEVRNNFIIK